MSAFAPGEASSMQTATLNHSIEPTPDGAAHVKRYAPAGRRSG